MIILYLGWCEGMLVKTWGTGLKINQLRWSINDIFNEAVQLLTLGQKGVYPVQSFTTKINTVRQQDYNYIYCLKVYSFTTHPKRKKIEC